MNKEREKMMERRQSAKEWAQQQSTGGFEATSVQLVPNYKFMTFEQGATVQLDILQYLAGYGNSTGDEGFPVWQRQYTIHRIPRPDGKEQRFVCPYRSFGKSCCVCKKIAPLHKDDPYRKAVKPQQRHLMIANDQLDKNLTGPFKLLDAVYYANDNGFGEQLFLAINTWRGEEDFFDLKNGLTLEVIVANDKWKQTKRINFVPRNYKYDPNLIKQMPCLDDCILLPMPRSLKEKRQDGQTMSHFISTLTPTDWALVDRSLQCILDGGSADDADDGSSNGHTSYSIPPKKEVPKQEELPTYSPPPKQQEAPKPGSKPVSFSLRDTVEYNGQEMQIIHLSKDGLSATLEDISEDMHKVKISDITRLVKSSSKQTAKVAADDDDDLEFDDDDE